MGTKEEKHSYNHGVSKGYLVIVSVRKEIIPDEHQFMLGTITESLRSENESIGTGEELEVFGDQQNRCKATHWHPVNAVVLYQ